MAEEKTTKTKKVEKPAEEPAVEQPVEDEYVQMYIPRRTDGSKGMYVNVNNDNVFVPYGKNLRVKKCNAEVIERSIRADEITAGLIDRLSNGANF